MKKLDGLQLKALCDALASAFPRTTPLERLLRFRMDLDLAKIVSAGGNHDDHVYEVVKHMESIGRLDDLVRGAVEENPGNPMLAKFQEIFTSLLTDSPPRISAPRLPEQRKFQPGELLWRTRVGMGAWKTESVFADNDTIIFSTAGQSWNVEDHEDGVLCLEIKDGRERWRRRTVGDANAILLEGNIIYFGTDSGYVYAVDIADGKERWKIRLEGSILARPVMMPQGLVVCSVLGRDAGWIHLLEPSSGKVLHGGTIAGGVVADPLLLDRRVLFASRSGLVVTMSFDGTWASIAGTQRVELKRSLHWSETFSFEFVEVHGAPIQWGSMILLPLVRDFTSWVPILAVDSSTLQVVWFGPILENSKTWCGNSRVRPVIAGGVAVLPVSYGNEVFAVSHNGVRVWESNCGMHCERQCASPIVYRDLVFLPRGDGHVYALHPRTGMVQWSLIIDESVTLVRPPAPASSPEQWDVRSDHPPLNSTPVIRDGVMYIVSSDGYAYAIRVAES